MAARLGEHYGITTYETPVGFKFIGPKMIETGAMMGAEESGGFGFGMHLPERDGVYADLMLLDLFLRERAAGRWPVSRAIEHFHEIAGPSFYLRMDVHVERAAYPETKRRLLVDLARAAADASWPASRSRGPGARDRRRLQVLRWLTGRGCSSGHPALSRSCACTSRRRRRRSATRCWGRGAAGPRLMTTDDGGPRRRVDKPWGHELIWAHTDRYVGKVLVIEAGKRLSLQRHEIKDESIYVMSGRLRLYLEDDAGDRPGRGARPR